MIVQKKTMLFCLILSSFYNLLNSRFTQLNTLVSGIIPPAANSGALKYAIWNFSAILENNANATPQ